MLAREVGKARTRNSKQAFEKLTHEVDGQRRMISDPPFLTPLSELMPEMFVEVSPQLAELRGLENGGWATLVTARSAIEARVLVTLRMAPLSS